MKNPDFWYQPPGLAARLLAPFGSFYGAATARRLARGAPEKLDVPVIGVGNLVAGGAGKTPLVRALVQLCKERGRRPAVISRGHGGYDKGPTRVDHTVMLAEQVGDEPLMMAEECPVYVARDRRAAAKLAIADGADVLVLDDGHQDPSLARDLSLIAIDGAAGFGNGLMIPAGPLREPVAVGLARADAIVLYTDDGTPAEPLPGGKPVIEARLVMDIEMLPLIRDRELYAFAGIGRPSKFFSMLERNGAKLVARESFPDHHDYKPEEIDRLVTAAHAAGASLVTTEKDWNRLSRFNRAHVRSVPVRFHTEPHDALDRLLDPLFKNHGKDA